MGITAQSLGITQTDIDDTVNGYLDYLDEMNSREANLSPHEHRVRKGGVFAYRGHRMFGVFVFGLELRVFLKWPVRMYASYRRKRRYDY